MRIRHGVQNDLFTIQHYLAGMLKHHGNAIPDTRLHLAQPPFGFLRMTNKDARRQE